MRSHFMTGVVIGSLVVAVAALAGTAFAGTGLGAVFHLGRTNTVDRVSTLTGSTSGKMLQVTNAGTGSALGLTTPPDAAPLRANSHVVVKNLNVDMLDGQHAATLNADTVDGLHGTSFARGPGTMTTFRESLWNDETKTLATAPGIGSLEIRGNGASTRIVFAASGQCDYFDSQGNYVTLLQGSFRTIFYNFQQAVRTSVRILVTSPGHVGTFDIAYTTTTGQILEVMIQGLCI